MKIPNIEVSSEKKIPTLLHYLSEGRVRVPRFQREFVWDTSRIIRLLDSIYKEYPIGSFFFWEAPAKYNLFYRDMPELGIVPSKPKSTEILNFILDGQQRTCSLYAAVHGRVVVEFDLPSGKKTIDCSRTCLDLDYVKKLPDAGNNIRVFEIQDED